MKNNISPRRLASLLSAMMILFPACSSLYEAPTPPVADSYVMQSEKKPAPQKAQNEKKMNNQTTPRTDKELSLDDCITIAIDNNPSGMSAKSAVDMAEEAAGKARAPYYPEIYASAGFSRFQKHASGPQAAASSSVIGPENDWTGSINARMTIWDAGERKARLDSALSGKEASINESERVKNEIITGVRKSFFALMSAVKAKDVALKNLARAETHLKTAEARYEAGSVPENDLLRARVGVADARLSLVRTESMISMSSGDLNAAMGISVDTDLKLRPYESEIRRPEEKDLEKAFLSANEKRPEIKAAMQKISASRSGIEEARAGFWPKLRAQAGYGWEDDSWAPSDKTWNAGITAEMPIFTGFAKTHDLAGKKAELRKGEAEARSTIQKVKTEVWKAFAMLRQAFETHRESKAMVKEAEESHRSTKERYDAGAATITDLLDARVSLARAEANLVTSEWEYFMAEAELRRASGTVEQTPDK